MNHFRRTTRIALLGIVLAGASSAAHAAEGWSATTLFNQVAGTPVAFGAAPAAAAPGPQQPWSVTSFSRELNGTPEEAPAAPASAAPIAALHAWDAEALFRGLDGTPE